MLPIQVQINKKKIIALFKCYSRLTSLITQHTRSKKLFFSFQMLERSNKEGINQIKKCSLFSKCSN